jgi:transposase
VTAEAICEAMSRPNMRFVSLKTVRQQDAQAAHRIRDKLMMQRTVKAIQIRGLASEYGLVAPIGIKKLREAIPIWYEDTENGLSSMFRILLNDLFSDLVTLDERVAKVDELIRQDVQKDPVAMKLLELRGICVLYASAL